MKMAHKDNFRVEVEPGPYHLRVDENQILKDCESIVFDVKRHVNDVQSCQICWDTKYTCSFCGYEWDEDETGEPLCCEEAIEEWENNKEEKPL